MHAQYTGNGSIWGYSSDLWSPMLGISYVRFKDHRSPQCQSVAWATAHGTVVPEAWVVVQSFEMFSRAWGKEPQGYRQWENNDWSPIADAWLVHCSPKGRQGNNNIICAFGIQCAVQGWRTVLWKAETIALEVPLGSSVLSRLAHCSLKGRQGSNNIWCAFEIQCVVEG